MLRVCALRWAAGRGQGLVEYALIVLLIAVAAFAAVALLAPSLGAIFTRMAASLAV